eukprot:3702851-Lingulodinium_polyedra.AAC.1
MAAGSLLAVGWPGLVALPWPALLLTHATGCSAAAAPDGRPARASGRRGRLTVARRSAPRAR